MAESRQVRLPDGLLTQVRRRLAATGTVPDPAGWGALVRDLGGVLGEQDLAELALAVRSEVEGAGPLQPLLELPEVSDVLVNGPRSVWVDRGAGLEAVDLDLGDAARVRGLAVRLAAAGGQRLDDACPVVDARLADGTRLHAVLPPVAADGALISLRTVRRTAFTLAELVATGSVAPEVGRHLSGLVARRASLLVSGATGTGKTTLLSALLGLVPPDQRIVCIEEAGELNPAHPHVVRLTARRANVEGVGEVDLVALVRHALRMRPDRIVLGEARGAEVREVLAALTTGHEGGAVTLHARTAEDVPARLLALGALAGMSEHVVAVQAAGALDVVVHLRRDAGRRRVAELGAVGRGAGGLEVTRVLHVDQDGRVHRGVGWAAFADGWGLDRVP